jgi:peptidoglycan glycosyltransferase
MSSGIRRVGFGVVALLLLLVGQLTYLQVVDARSLAHDERNGRDRIDNLRAPRGKILSGDLPARVMARSVDSNDELERQREYPFGELTAQVVGYQSIVVGSTGLEETYDDVLTGKDKTGVATIDRTREFLTGQRRVGNLVTSLRVDAQLLAKNALGDQRGSVVVLRPDTGEIVAMYSNPSYDPQPLAGHRTKQVQVAFDLLSNAPGNPALPRAYREIYPPGSTFKVVTTSAGLGTGTVTLDSRFPVERSFTPPQAARGISNFGGSSCGGDLTYVFVHSCNAAFARMGLALGEQFPPAMRSFGIYQRPPLDVAPGAVASRGPVPGTFEATKPFFALAGIGQGDVATTPLQMALAAGAIANGGVVMKPHVGVAVQDDEGKVIRTFAPEQWLRATDPATAGTVRDLMVQVVNSRGGTGTAAAIDGIAVAGKTGTAQTTPERAPHAWFVAFAPAEAPRFAVAVLVEEGGSASNEATGGRVAAPIAKQLLQFLLGV